MHLSIRELVVALLALLLFAFGGIIWTNRTTANAEIVAGMQSILANVSASTTARSEDFLSDARGSAEVAAYTLEKGALNSDDELESFFGSVLEATPSVNGIFYGTVEGDFAYVTRSSDVDGALLRTKFIRTTDGSRIVELIYRDESFAAVESRLDPDDPYDPRTRPWFQRAMADQGTILTDPYVFFTSQQPGVTAASPVRNDEGDIVGIVGVDIELSDLSTFLADLSLGRNGTGFIFNTDGEVVALEDQSLIRQPDGDGFRLSSVDELNSEVLRSSYEASIDIGSQPRTFVTQEGDSTLHAFVAPIDQTDWILGVALDEDDFLGDVRNEQQRSNLVAVALGLVGIVAGWRLIQNVVAPLRDLRGRALRIQEGDLEETEPSTAVIDELRETSDAFDQMVASLLERRQESADEIADLRRQLEAKQNREMAIDLIDAREFGDEPAVVDAPEASGATDPVRPGRPTET
ncbi:MAG: cache and HAMP domain-containing protein [Acidimicrobiales bacterium]|nr:cache and HAMP domain-containing protein [Acidimicrobiales bacterium]